MAKSSGGPSQPGHESYESAHDRGAYTGSRADWNSYSNAANVAERSGGSESGSGRSGPQEDAGIVRDNNTGRFRAIDTDNPRRDTEHWVSNPSFLMTREAAREGARNANKSVEEHPAESDLKYSEEVVLIMRRGLLGLFFKFKI